MPLSYDEIIRGRAQTLYSGRARALAELEQANLNDDQDGIHAASDAIESYDARLRSLEVYAWQQRQPQPRMPGRRVEIKNENGDKLTVQLSDEEVDIARRSLVDRPGIKTSDDDKLRSYAQNKTKLADMRASGRYEDRGS
jgi:hypothetical protein